MIYSWWFRNPAITRWYVVYLPLFTRFYLSQVVGLGISEPSTVVFGDVQRFSQSQGWEFRVPGRYYYRNPQKSTGTWENPPGKGETSRNYQFWGSMFVFSSVRSPSPLWHRKRSPRGVAFGCSTRCAKSTNFGCECGSIGNWRRERKQHIFVNAVNAKVAWIRIEWLIEWRI